MHSDWFNGMEILQGRWHHGERVGYCYPSGLEKTLCKCDICVPLVTKGLTLLHVSAKQISHHQVGHGHPKRVVVLNKPHIQYLYSCVFVG